jgi:branched-subunit amino acid aminotransferase/4-amino-4-deoxychorismate lyase
MNQVQAALEVKQTNPSAIPLILDSDGNIAETNTGNFFFVSDGRLHTSSARTVLGGVTRATILEIANELGIESVEGNFTPYDVYAADEAFVCSTTPVIVPAVSLNGAPVGDGNLPGPVTLRLMKRFVELAGVDFVSQAISKLGDNASRDLSAGWAADLAE